MLDFSITHVGVYRNPEKFIQTVNAVWIFLYVSGVNYSRRYLPNGMPLKEVNADTPPHLGLTLPGMKVDFEYTERRENWVLMLKDFPLRASQDAGYAEINMGTWLKIPYFTELERELVPVWRQEMRNVQNALKNPTPLSVCKAKMDVMNMLRFMLGRLTETEGNAPEEQLKRMIDEDLSFSKGISEMGEACNVSRDHLRVLFQKRYQINPQAYRLQRRNTFIMELVANSTLSVKEIAARTGFKHDSHFCVEFQRQFGLKPKDAIRRFRYQQTGNQPR
jgi:AraC-like DNA-binding protein